MVDIEVRLAILEAHENIRTLASRYATAVDQQDARALRGLFAHGSSTVLPGALAGPEGGEVRDAGDLLAPLARYVRTRHTVAQHTVHVDGAVATGEVYGEAHHIYERDGQLHDRTLMMRYLDGYTRTTQGWQFARRELHVDWVTDSPVRTLEGRGERS